MRPMTVALLVVLAATLLATWWFSSFERVTRSEFIGYSGEARFNRFYAGESLLRSLDIEADSVARLQPSRWLPDAWATLVLPFDPAVSEAGEGDALADWIVAGGHLVVLMRNFEAFDGSAFGDFLAERLDLGLVRVEPVEPEPDADAEDDEADSDYTANLLLASHRLLVGEPSMAEATLSDELGVLVARYTYGDGIVTAVATETFFTNTNLADEDHGRLLLDIVDGHIESGEVWFVFSSRFDPLWRILWTELPLTVLAAVAGLLLGLYTLMQRFGPPLRPLAAERRSLMEHIRAAGHFDWRQKDAESLAASSVASLLHAAERRHPGLLRKDTAEQAKRLSGITGLAFRDLAGALSLHDIDKPQAFARHMQTLQQARSKL